MNMIVTRKFTFGLFAVALCAIVIGAALVPHEAQASSTVRISQLYGGGGGGATSGATYNVDYIELFNNSNAPIVVPAPGWSLQYGSATGTSFGSTAGNTALIPAGTIIPACGYLLIQSGTPSAGGGPLPVAADIVSVGPAISATTGKIALMDYQTLINGCTAIPPSTFGNTIGGNPHIIDALGFGPTANCFETAATAVLTNASAAVRNLFGEQDTDNNSLDFTVTLSPVPRNSATPADPGCVSGTLLNTQTWGRLKTIYR